MRKIWPPTYDDFSVRIWAAILSTIINLLLWSFAMLGAQFAFFGLFPGLIPAFAIAAIIWHGVEGSGITILGFTTVIAANFGFYYLICWVFINLFRPATNWWPEKHS